MKLPKIGMGTFGSDRYDEETVASAVGKALELGYRLFDCASVYGNERQIGRVFADAFAAGTVRREDVVVMSKVWNDMHGDGAVRRSCEQTLRDLGLDCLDVYFVHWPFPNFHAKGCDGNSRNESSRPFFTDEFVAVWRGRAVRYSESAPEADGYRTNYITFTLGGYDYFVEYKSVTSADAAEVLEAIYC